MNDYPGDLIERITAQEDAENLRLQQNAKIDGSYPMMARGWSPNRQQFYKLSLIRSRVSGGAGDFSGGYLWYLYEIILRVRSRHQLFGRTYRETYKHDYADPDTKGAAVQAKAVFDGIVAKHGLEVIR